jgi:hypothetical protein
MPRAFWRALARLAARRRAEGLVLKGSPQKPRGPLLKNEQSDMPRGTVFRSVVVARALRLRNRDARAGA